MKQHIEDDSNQWLGKAEAAALLGVSVRQLELKTAQGKVRKRALPKLPSERAARVVYSREDLDAIRAGQPHNYSGTSFSPPLALVPPNAPAADPFAELTARLAASFQPFAALAQAFPPPVAAKPWLTLAEAQVFSGLTGAWLLKEAESADSSIAIRDMGKHARGGRWRFLRDDLAKNGAGK